MEASPRRSSPTQAIDLSADQRLHSLLARHSERLPSYLGRLVKIKTSIATSVVVAPLLFLAVVGCGRSEFSEADDLAFRTYFQRLESFFTTLAEHQHEPLSVSETRTLRESIPLLRERENVYRQLVNKLENLVPPEQLDLIHENSVERAGAAVDALTSLIDALESRAAAEVTEEAVSNIEETAARFNETCRDLQLIANQNSLVSSDGDVINLRCSSPDDP